MKDPETRAGILAVAPGALSFTRKSDDDAGRSARTLEAERFYTLGKWAQR